MMHSLLQMANRVCRNTNVPSVQSDGVTPTNYVQQKVIEWLNRRYKTAYETMLWPKTIDFFTVALQAGVQEVTLPKQIGLVLRITDQSGQEEGNSIYLIDPASYSDKVLALRNLFRTFLEWEEDTPVGTCLGVSNVLAQPTAASTVTVVSNSTKDNTGAGNSGQVTVFLRGMSTAYEVITESLLTTGTAPVTSANTYLYVNAVSKTGPSIGLITVAQTGGGTIATINTWEVSPEYQRIKLEVAPTAPSNFRVCAQRAYVPMLNWADVPAFDCEEIIVSGATQDAFEEQKQWKDAAAAEAKFDKNMKDFWKKYEELSGNAELMIPLGRA